MRKFPVIKVSSVRTLKFVPMVGFSGLLCKNAFNSTLKARVTRYGTFYHFVPYDFIDIFYFIPYNINF